ncbi:MAG: LiaF domain-containing protein [Thermoanaerobaculia bacterium]
MSRNELTEHTPIKGLVSIFSGNEKKGRWELPRHMRVLAIFGGATIDLRQAVVLPGVSVIETLTIFGGIEIIVPPQIDVECDGDAIMGAFTLARSKKGPASFPPPPGAPLVRVIGDAYMGAVTVQVKAPREKVVDQLTRKLLDR